MGKQNQGEHSYLRSRNPFPCVRSGDAVVQILDRRGENGNVTLWESIASRELVTFISNGRHNLLEV